MNKFFVIALIAVSACVASAQVETDSQFALLSSTAQDEVAKIPKELAIYSDFCIRTRDQLYHTIRTESNGAAAQLFKVMIGKVADVAKATIETQEFGLDRISNQIEHPEAEIAGSDGSEAQEMIVEGQKKIQEVELQPKSLLYGIQSLFAASANTAAKQASAAINALVSNVKNVQHVISAAYAVCERAEQFNSIFREEFEAFNAEIAAGSRVNVGKTVTYEDVKCLTAGRIDSLDALCKFAAATKGPVGRLYTRTFVKPQA